MAAKEKSDKDKDKGDDPQANHRALQAELRKQAKQRKQAVTHVDQVMRLEKQLAEAKTQRDAKLDEFASTKDRVAKLMELASEEGKQADRMPILPVVAALDAVDKDGIPETLVPKLDSMVVDFKKLMAEIETARVRPDKRAPADKDEEVGRAAKKKAEAGPDGAPQAAAPPAAPAPAKPAEAASGAAPAAKTAPAAKATEGKAASEDPDQVFKALEQAADSRRRRREKAAEKVELKTKPAADGKGGDADAPMPQL